MTSRSPGPTGEPCSVSSAPAVAPGRTGPIGADGPGKTTLLRLIAGDLTATGGTVRVDGTVGHLRQGLTLSPRMRVDEVRRPAVLLLDQPANNLDPATVAQLTAALGGYRGALVVAGHDRPFLRDLGITRWIEAGR